jgi:hypothetical protein
MAAQKATHLRRLLVPSEARQIPKNCCKTQMSVGLPHAPRFPPDGTCTTGFVRICRPLADLTWAGGRRGLAFPCGIDLTEVGA